MVEEASKTTLADLAPPFFTAAKFFAVSSSFRTRDCIPFVLINVGMRSDHPCARVRLACEPCSCANGCMVSTCTRIGRVCSYLERGTRSSGSARGTCGSKSRKPRILSSATMLSFIYLLGRQPVCGRKTRLKVPCNTRLSSRRF